MGCSASKSAVTETTASTAKDNNNINDANSSRHHHHRSKRSTETNGLPPPPRRSSLRQSNISHTVEPIAEQPSLERQEAEQQQSDVPDDMTAEEVKAAVYLNDDMMSRVNDVKFFDAIKEIENSTIANLSIPGNIKGDEGRDNFEGHLGKLCDHTSYYF